jgi:hypothetical protein
MRKVQDSPSNSQGEGPVVIPLSKDVGQRSLFSLKKVVRLGKNTTAVTFTIQDLQNIRAKLENASTGKHELLQSMRRLQCYRLCLEDLRVSGLGGIVRVLSIVHPKDEVRKAAGMMMQKWKRMVLKELFPLPRPVRKNKTVEEIKLVGDQEGKVVEGKEEEEEEDTFGYDVETARVAPEGCDVPPEELIRLEEEQEQYEKMCRKRERIEADPLMCSSTEEEDGESDSDFWSPGMEKRRRAAQRLAAKRLAASKKASGDVDDLEEEGHEEVEEKPVVAIPPKKQLSRAFQKLFSGSKTASQSEKNGAENETIDLVSGSPNENSNAGNNCVNGS